MSQLLAASPGSRRGARVFVPSVLAGAVTVAGLGVAEAAPVPASGLAAGSMQARPLPTASAPAGILSGAVAAHYPTATSRIYLKYGSRGATVKRLQRKLHVRPVSGWYGPITTRAVKRFQRRHHLSVTGRVDATTWTRLGLGPLPGSSGGSEPRRGSYTYNLGPVRAHVRAAAYDIGPRFGIRTIGGWRRSAADMSGHPAGLALDFMCSRSQGDALSAYVKSNAAKYRVEYIIWNRRIWHVGRASEGWRYYSGWSPHTDHVHVNFKA